METIHTDSAYRSQSNKKFGGPEIKMPLDQSISDNDRRILRNSVDEDQSDKLSTDVS
jgi:GPI-anchor transamidase subunit K